MNKKFLLLLASSVIAAGIIANGDCVNAKLNVYPSNGAIMEQSQPDYVELIKEISNSKEPAISKLIDGTFLYGENGNFTQADVYFEGLCYELEKLKAEDKVQFDRYIKICTEKFLNMSQNNPTSAAAKYYVFKIMFISENYDYAEEAIKRCIELDSNNPVFQFELGNVYMLAGKYSNAMRIFKKLTEYYPREEEFRIALAKAYEMKGMYKESVKEYRVAATFLPDDNDVVVNLVQAKISEKNSKDFFNDTANKLLESLNIPTEKHPFVKDAAGNVINLNSENLPNKSVVSDEVVENTDNYTPDNVQQNVTKEVLAENNQSNDGKYYIYGQKTVTNTEKFTLAPGAAGNTVVNNSQNAVMQDNAKQDNNIFEQTENKSEVLVSEKVNKNVKKNDKKITKNSDSKTSDNTELYLKANKLMAEHEYQKVIDLLSKINPPTLRSLTSIASCYSALGNSNMALAYYRDAEKLEPQNSKILFSIAYIYYSVNDINNAKNYLERSLKADPNNAEAIKLHTYILQNDSNEVMNKAVSYLNAGNYTESKRILDELAQKDSSNFQVHYYLGHIAYATQKYADSVQEFIKAVKLNPEYSLSYYSLGLAYDKLQKYSDSLASYEKFVQMTPDDNKYTQYAKSRINTIKAKK